MIQNGEKWSILSKMIKTNGQKGSKLSKMVKIAQNGQNGPKCRGEQDPVILQEFLIPGVLWGYLECVHFPEITNSRSS